MSRPQKDELEGFFILRSSNLAILTYQRFDNMLVLSVGYVLDNYNDIGIRVRRRASNGFELDVQSRNDVPPHRLRIVVAGQLGKRERRSRHAIPTQSHSDDDNNSRQLTRRRTLDHVTSSLGR